MNIRMTHVLAAFSLIAFTGASAYAQSQQQQNPDQKQDKVQYDQKQNQDIQGGKQPDESHRASGRDQGVDPHTGKNESKDSATTGATGGAATGSTGAATGAAAASSTQPQPERGATPAPKRDQGASAVEKRDDRQMNLSSISADKFIGMKVKDKQGKDIGEIKDVVVNLQSGRIHAAVLEFGGILGIGEKAYAFPVSEVQPGKKRNELMVNVDKKRLENAEGFAKNEWPKMDDDYWGRVGQKSSAGATKGKQQAKGKDQQPAAGAGGMQLVRVSELEGKEVQAKGGEDVGEIEEVVLDIKGGKLRHVVLDVDDGGRMNVQANQLRPGTDDKLVLAMDAQELKQQAQRSKGERRPGAREDRARTSTGPTGGSATGGTATLPDNSRSR